MAFCADKVRGLHEQSISSLRVFWLSLQEATEKRREFGAKRNQITSQLEFEHSKDMQKALDDAQGELQRYVRGKDGAGDSAPYPYPYSSFHYS